MPAPTLAATLGLPLRTVYRLLAAFRQAHQATPPQYQACGRPRSTLFATLREETLALRSAHPTWGAGRIDAELRLRYPQLCRPGCDPLLPHPSTLRLWLAGTVPPPHPTGRPPSWAPRAVQPHDIWQLDAAEKKPLRSGQKVCWLRQVDEATSAVLFSRVFPQACWAEVGAIAVQAALRSAYARWGRPWGQRVDNGNPWVCPHSDLPSDLELWLAGLDIALYRNPKRCPEANGLVERSQRTASDWAEPRTCATPEQLQQRLDEEDRIQRAVYRFDGRQTRLQAFPELLHSGRPYLEGRWEDLCWDLSSAWRCLAECVVERQVDREGDVSLYDYRHRVGKAYRGQRVRVRLDVARGEWLFEQEGQEVGCSVAAHLSAAHIRQLELRRRPGRSAQQTQRRRAQQAAVAARSRGDGPRPPSGNGAGGKSPQGR